MNKLSFLININKNSLLVKFENEKKVTDFNFKNNYEYLGELYKSLSKLNKEKKISIIFDIEPLPFVFILTICKIQFETKKFNTNFEIYIKCKETFNFIKELQFDDKKIPEDFKYLEEFKNLKINLYLTKV